jgi:serine/threonine protein kinase
MPRHNRRRVDDAMSEPPTTALVATTVGRYRVVRLIAHGGMGSLYLARDPAINRLVALKLLQEGFDDDAARVRFAREARATGGLRHPNIVTVFDVGEHGQRPFIAMEYVAGETLAQLLRRRAPLTIGERLAILEDLCAGLQFAHAAGIVHRDIKPANVMLDVAGNVKILDFGLARAPDSGITKSGEQLGTLNYMSPEQVVGGHLDHRSDVYAVGALAYELMSHEKAFPGTVQDGVMYRILSASPPPLETLVPDIDPEIPKIVGRAMAKEPEQRYQTLDQLREELIAVRVRLAAIESEALLVVEADAETGDASGTPRPSQAPVSAPPRTSGRPALAGVARDSSLGEDDAIVSSAPTMSSLAQPSVSDAPGPRTAPQRRRRVAWLGAAAATLALIVVAVVYQAGRPVPRPTTGGPTAPSPQPPPAATPSGQPAAGLNRPDDPDRIEEHLRVVRSTARQQIDEGQRQRALDTLSAGLVLRPVDPELNAMVDELKRTARQMASRARLAASRRGATERSPGEFQDARTREREADSLDRAGDSAQAIRALWDATDLYERASKAPSQIASNTEPPAAGPPSRAEIPKAQVPPTAPELHPAAPPVPSPPFAPPPIGTAALPPPPTSVKPEPGTRSAPGTTEGSGDLAAIQDTLRRYGEAYRNRDVAAVRAVLPSLTTQQVRGLEKDFANYRNYRVEIADPRIVVDQNTATATASVTRSFVTTNGVAGGHTVATTFRLRKIDGAWVIDRLESR